MSDTNIVMDFECTRGCRSTYGITKGDVCKLVRVDAEHIKGLVCLTIERSDGAHISMWVDSLETLSRATVKLYGPHETALYLRKIMRKPWRLDQMMRGYLNTENSLGSVTRLAVKSV